MEDMGLRAEELFKKGYNCSQAVFLAFAPSLGLDEDMAAKLSSSFGGGIGRMREVCGAVCGMALVLGMKYGYDDPCAVEEKREHYARIQKLANEFRDANGSIICRELLGLSPVQPLTPGAEVRTPEFYKKRPCAKLVRMAAEITQKYIEDNP